MSRQDFTPPPPRHRFIAHRGISALAPENTLASFNLAAAQGIDWIEFDLRLTKDNHLVIFHDDTLERITHEKGFIHEKTLESLSTLDAGTWFSPQFKGEKIPLFSQILPELIRLKCYLNIELKIPPQANKTHQHTLTQTLRDVLLTHWPSTVPWPLISSFHWDLLWDFRTLIPTAPLGFLQDVCTQDLIELVTNTPNASLHCHYQSLNETLLANARKIPLLVYTINEPEIAQKLLKSGVYGIFSDNPLHLQKMLAKAP